MKIDWNASSSGGYGPGLHLVMVGKAEEKRSKKGDAYFNLRLDTESFDGNKGTLCFDVVMVQGGGAGIGLAKLKALGFDNARDVIEPEDIQGRRAWVNVDFEWYDGKKRLKVVTNFEPTFTCGYWPENEKPEGYSMARAPVSDDDAVPW